MLCDSIVQVHCLELLLSNCSSSCVPACVCACMCVFVYLQTLCTYMLKTNEPL